MIYCRKTRAHTLTFFSLHVIFAIVLLTQCNFAFISKLSVTYVKPINIVWPVLDPGQAHHKNARWSTNAQRILCTLSMSILQFKSDSRKIIKCFVEKNTENSQKNNKVNSWHIELCAPHKYSGLVSSMDKKNNKSKHNLGFFSFTLSLNESTVCIYR